MMSVQNVQYIYNSSIHLKIDASQLAWRKFVFPPKKDFTFGTDLLPSGSASDFYLSISGGCGFEPRRECFFWIFL